MKTVLLFSFTFFSYSYLSAQNLYTSEQFNFSFVTTEVLENYITETDYDSLLGYDNDNYAVDIEMRSTLNQPDLNSTDIKSSTRSLANTLGFKNSNDGGTIPHIKEAYYVISKGKFQNTLFPVYIMLVINQDLKIAYEITVYCYNMNLTEGESILKSFKLLDS